MSQLQASLFSVFKFARKCNIVNTGGSRGLRHFQLSSISSPSSSPTGSRLNFIRLYSSNSDVHRNDTTSSTATEDENYGGLSNEQGSGAHEDTKTALTENLTSTKEVNADQQNLKSESITSRLRRLSETAPEDFVPSFTAPAELQKAKLRYKDVMVQHRDKFSREEFMKSRNPNYRPRNRDGHGGGDGWYQNRRNDYHDQDHRSGVWRDNQSRWMSTSTRHFADVENIIDRLKRLSVTSEKNYRPSENAQKLKKDSEKRQKNSRQSLEEYDQKNFRPYNQRHSRNSNSNSDNYNNNYSNKQGRYNGSVNDNGRKYGGKIDRWAKPGREQYEPRISQEFDALNEEINSELDPSFEKIRIRSKKERSLRQYDESYFMRKRKDMSTKSTREVSESRADYVEQNDSSGVVTLNSNSVKTHGRSLTDAEIDLSSLLQNDSDNFGTLSLGPVPVKDYVTDSVNQDLLEDEKTFGFSPFEKPEEDDRIEIDLENKWNMKKLVYAVKQLVDEMKVKEAVDTLTSALDKGGFPYDPRDFVYIYNLCISSCAQVGYVKMAFKLFNDMKKRRFPPKESTYTSLFNSCANAVWDSEKNLERMNNLRQNMLEKGIFPNQIIYHAMIKGYGRNGDIESAFSIVDEMINSGNFRPTTETFNMLLQACITNTDNGFRHVIVTWRKMQSIRIRPDIYSFNLLLRAIRDCGIKPESFLLEQEQNSKIDAMTEMPPIVSEEDSNDMLNLLCVPDPNSQKQALLNFNERVLTNVNMEWSYHDLIKVLAKPENRLAVFGGLRGFMAQLSHSKVSPNLKSVTELAMITHPSDIGDLLNVMKAYKLKPDITFFNMMIRKCYSAGNSIGARRILMALPQYNLTPDILTWGVAATGCRVQNSAFKLLTEMDNANFMPNIQILGALLSNACNNFDPRYVSWVMHEILRREVVPDPKFVLLIEKFKQDVKGGLINQETNRPITPPKLEEALADKEGFEEYWKRFLYNYESWMKTTQVVVDPKDPWEDDFNTFRKHRSHKPITDQVAEDEISSKK